MDKVSGWLLAGKTGAGPVDFHDTLIIVPTLQAGRCLREALARRCHERQSVLLSTTIVTPHYFFSRYRPDTKAANPSLTKAVWAEVLEKADLTQFSVFFPHPDRLNNIDKFQWALATGEIIEGLRQELADGGYGIPDVIGKHEKDLQELERWRDLAGLEKLYLQKIEELGFCDACRMKIGMADNPELEPGVTRIVAAGVPDPTLLAVRALQNLARDHSVDILIHAPETMANKFDEWGRPIAGEWAREEVDIPDWDKNVFLEASPDAQSQQTVEILAGLPAEYGPTDIGIGVPDTAVIPFLKNDLRAIGLPAFDPSDALFSEHALGRLVDSMFNLLPSRAYLHVADLLRHPDFLRYLEEIHKIEPRHVLTQLDEFQNHYLPVNLESMLAPFAEGFGEHGKPKAEKSPDKPEYDAGCFAALGKALKIIKEHIDTFGDKPPEKAWRSFLQSVYEARKISRDNARDREFQRAAGVIEETFRELRQVPEGKTDRSGEAPRGKPQGIFAEPCEATEAILSSIAAPATEDHPCGKPQGFLAKKDKTSDTFAENFPGLPTNRQMSIWDGGTAALGMDKNRFHAIFCRRLREQAYSRERDAEILDLQGWLELPWTDTPFLVVTGMNEEFVPGGSLSDVFLPDSLRKILKLRDDLSRFGRDVYLLKSLVESRRSDGRFCVIVGKYALSGDPLRPSRLLLRCPPGKLPARAEQLFKHIRQTERVPAAETIFRLKPSDCEKDDKILGKKTIPVTAFRDYLACPFRFYLRRILKMEALSDEKTEMDALDFGQVIHAVLQAMGANEQLWACRDAEKLGKALGGMAAKIMAGRYGKNLPLGALVALSSARARLEALAREQVALTKAGWEIIASEQNKSITGNEFTIIGKIDRIDRHKDSGLIRIIDYKTSDTARSPKAEHLAKRRDETPDYNQLVFKGKEGRKGSAGDKEFRWVDLQLPLYRRMYDDGNAFNPKIELAYFNLPKAVGETGLSVWEDFNDDTMDSADNCIAGILENIANGTFWPPAGNVKYDDDFKTLFFDSPEKAFDVNGFTS